MKVTKNTICVKFEVYTHNGAWNELVLAESRTEALEKLKDKYANYTKIEWISEWRDIIY